MSDCENPRFTERTSTNLGRSHRLPHVCTIMIYGKLGGYRLQETAAFIYVIYTCVWWTMNNMWYLGIANVDIRRPRPLPKQGRRLGPPEVWNLALGSQAKAHAIKATPLSATCPSHLHAPAVCPASNPPNSPQASKATTLTATCPCHLLFRGFKTVLQLHAPAICFSGGSRLPFARPQPSKRFRRPPRQQLLQLHAPAICFSGGSRLPFARPQTPQTLPTLPQASKATTLTAIYMPLPSVFQGVQDCRLPGLKPPKRFQPFRRRVQDCRLPALTPSKRFRRLPRQQLLQLHTCPCHLFFRGFKTAVCPASNPPNASNPPAGLQGNNSYSYMPLPSVFQGFKTAVCPASNPPNASNPPAGLQGNNSYSYMPLPSIFQGVQDCRLPGLKPSKRFRRPPRQQLLQLHAPAICFSGGSQDCLTATCPCDLFFRRFKTAVCPASSLQTLPQASKATTLTATCPCHLFFRGFKTAVCPASNPPNASDPSAGLQGNNSYSYIHAPDICFSGGSRLPFARPQTPQTLPTLPQAGSRLPFARPHTLQTLPQASKATTLTATYMPLPSVFQGVQDCRLPGLKPPKRFQPSRRPPRQQLLQLHAPAICFSRGSRLPFARPQTPQTLPTLPQASKATTLTATCPCHLFFKGFKTAVCLASNPPNASAGLQGNNSYSYMPLPSVFQGVQDCRLPGL